MKNEPKKTVDATVMQFISEENMKKSHKKFKMLGFGENKEGHRNWQNLKAT